MATTSMTVRRWLCRHPGLAQTVASTLSCCFALAGGGLYAYLADRGVVPRSPLFALAILALACLGVAAFAFAVAVALGRSGLPVSGVLKGLKFTPIAVALFLPLFAVVQLVVFDGELSDFVDEPATAVVAVGMCFALMVLQLIGWGAGALLVRRQVRRGKWEVTAATAPAGPGLSRRQWIATHPVWAMNLLTAAVAMLTVFAAIICMQAVKEEMLSAEKGLRLLWLGYRSWAVVAALGAATVGVLLARRGQSTQRALLSAFWFPLTVLPPFVLLCLCLSAMHESRGGRATEALGLWTTVLACYYGLLWLIAGQFAGWLLSAGYAFVARRRQK